MSSEACAQSVFRGDLSCRVTYPAGCSAEAFCFASIHHVKGMGESYEQGFTKYKISSFEDDRR